jgi:hypothetical protein
LSKGDEVLVEKYRATLRSWFVVDLDAETAESAARLRAALKLKLADAVQAASARAIGADALATHDRDFSSLRDLRVIGVDREDSPNRQVGCYPFVNFPRESWSPCRRDIRSARMNNRPKDTTHVFSAMSDVGLLSAGQYERLRRLEGRAMHVSELSDEELSVLERVEIPGESALCDDEMT